MFPSTRAEREARRQAVENADFNFDDLDQQFLEGEPYVPPLDLSSLRSPPVTERTFMSSFNENTGTALDVSSDEFSPPVTYNRNHAERAAAPCVNHLPQNDVLEEGTRLTIHLSEGTQQNLATSAARMEVDVFSPDERSPASHTGNCAEKVTKDGGDDGIMFYEGDSLGESSEDKTDEKCPNSNNSRGKNVHFGSPLFGGPARIESDSSSSSSNSERVCPTDQGSAIYTNTAQSLPRRSPPSTVWRVTNNPQCLGERRSASVPLMQRAVVPYTSSERPAPSNADCDPSSTLSIRQAAAMHSQLEQASYEAERLKTACRKLKDKTTEANEVKEELRAAKEKLQRCEIHLATTKSALTKSQQEARQAEQKQASMEQEMMCLHEKVEELRNAEQCRGCTNKIAPVDIRYIIDTMKDSESSRVNGCVSCTQRAGEWRRVEEQLTLLYRAARCGESSPTTYQPSFLEQENRRIMIEHNAALEEIVSLKSALDNRNSLVQQTHESERQLLKRENNRLSACLRDALQDVENLKEALDQQNSSSTVANNEVICALRDEKKQLLSELENLREQIDQSSSTSSVATVKDGRSEKNDQLQREISNMAEQIHFLSERNKQLNAELTSAQEMATVYQQKIKMLSEMEKVQSDDHHQRCERLNKKLKELQEEMEGEKNENSRLRIKLKEVRCDNETEKEERNNYRTLYNEVKEALEFEKKSSDTLRCQLSTALNEAETSRNEAIRLKTQLQEAREDAENHKQDHERLKNKLTNARQEIECIRESMERPVKTSTTQAWLECDSCQKLKAENENLATKFNEVVCERDSLQSRFRNCSLASTQTSASCETCSVLRRENERLYAELRASSSEIKDCVTVSTSAADSFNTLRYENGRLVAQLEDAREQLSRLKEQFRSSVSTESACRVKSAAYPPPEPDYWLPEPRTRGSAPMLSVTDMCGRPCAAPAESHHEQYEYDMLLERQKSMECQIADLTQKLLDFNKKKKMEMDDFNCLLDECNREKELLAEKQRKTATALQEKKAEVERLREEMNRVKDQSALSEYQTCLEENNMLKQQAANLQIEFDLLKQTSQANKENTQLISKLKAQVTHLEAELDSLRQTNCSVMTAREHEDLRSLELNKLQHELTLAQKDIELYHKGQSPSGSTAYIIRMRDQTIAHLHEKIAEMERVCHNYKKAGVNPSRSSVSAKSPEPEHRDDKSEMLLIMTNETTRMEQKIAKLEHDNVKLIELIKQRDAKIFEMRDEIEWLVKGSTQQDMITTYTQKLKKGEEEMGLLHQSMEELTKKHSSLIIAKESELLEVRTDYAKQLSHLLDDCTNRTRAQEVEMRKLLNDLDNLEKRNFELERAVRDYEKMKTEQIPRLRTDLEELRKAKCDLRTEFDRCNQHLKAAQREIELLQKDKLDTVKNHEVELAKKHEEVVALECKLEANEMNKHQVLRQKDVENGHLREELVNLSAKIVEREGDVTHWKIKHEDVNRQISDLEERHRLVLKAKYKEVSTLTKQLKEMSSQLDKASTLNDSEVFRLQSQLKEVQRQHVDLSEQHAATLKLKEDEMKRLYSEIGDLSARLHAISKDKEMELRKLKKELSSLKDEKEAILADSQASVQNKQVEIRKLMVEAERTEVEAARQRAMREREMTSLQTSHQEKIDKLTADWLSEQSVKDSEIKRLKQEVEKLVNEAKNGGSSITELKKQIILLEQDKNELLMLKDQWQSDMDKLYTEYEICKKDKVDFEEMVDRLSKEMEERLESQKRDHRDTVKEKDAQLRDMYIKVEAIARERGEMSAHLHKVLQQKELKIVELFEKLEEYDRCMDDAEHSFKNKLHKKSEEVRWLREEIQKMGEEGLRLLEMREKEIVDMRAHLQDMLKVMNHKYRGRTSSQVLINRPERINITQPHLRPAGKQIKTGRTTKPSKTGVASPNSKARKR